MSEFELVKDGEHHRLRGRLSFASAADLWARRAEVLNGSGPVVLDLSELQQSDSAGLACLVNLHGEALRQHRELRLIQVPAQLMDMARVSGVDGILLLAE